LKERTACGATVNAWKYCLSCSSTDENDPKRLLVDEYDYQMQFMVSKLMPRLDMIDVTASMDDQQAQLAHQVYMIAKVRDVT
jgi:hypothetical protein